MSFGTHGTAAIPDRLSVEYAPTGRAACKTCGGAIHQDSVKMGEKVRSPWHDGFDIKWHHATQRCGLVHAAKSVHDFKGFQRLRWADQVKLATTLRPELEGVAQLAEVQRTSEMMWEVKDLLEKVPKNALREVLTENGIFVSDKASPAAMLHGLADGLLGGKVRHRPPNHSPAVHSARPAV